MEIHKTVSQNVVMVAYKSVFEWLVAYDRWLHMEVRLYNVWIQYGTNHAFTELNRGFFRPFYLIANFSLGALINCYPLKQLAIMLSWAILHTVLTLVSPNILIKILQTDLNTFPQRISWENLIEDQFKSLSHLWSLWEFSKPLLLIMYWHC